MWTETAKVKERICGEKSVVNLVNGFVVLVLIFFSSCDMYEVKKAFPKPVFCV